MISAVALEMAARMEFEPTAPTSLSDRASLTASLLRSHAEELRRWMALPWWAQLRHEPPLGFVGSFLADRISEAFPTLDMPEGTLEIYIAPGKAD